jgi:hypothetical protein
MGAIPMGIKLEFNGNNPLEPGTYDAILSDVEAQDGGQYGPAWKWLFTAYDVEIEMPLLGFTSTNFHEKSKSYQWVAAILGRQLAPGEVLDTDDLCPGSCRLVLTVKELPDGRRVNRIAGVLPSKQKASGSDDRSQ